LENQSIRQSSSLSLSSDLFSPHSWYIPCNSKRKTYTNTWRNYLEDFQGEATFFSQLSYYVLGYCLSCLTITLHWPLSRLWN
jgi:hypothetical protein